MFLSDSCVQEGGRERRREAEVKEEDESMLSDFGSSVPCVIAMCVLAFAASPEAIVDQDALETEWIIQTVDSEYYAGTSSSISINADGFPQISYVVHLADNLKFARWDGDAWNIETVDEPSQVRGYHSHDVDSKGFPHIGYYALKEGVKYARWDGMNWNIEIVDTEDTFGSVSLALDDNDNPHIAYHSANMLKYAFWDGTNWTREVVHGPIAKHSHSIAVRSNGYPQISYYGEYEYQKVRIHCARWTGNEWSIEVPDTITRAGSDRPTSIAVDNENNPHIGYHALRGTLMYTRWNGSAWNTETVDSERRAGGLSSLAFDRNGYPHFAYGFSPGSRYARWNGSAWNIETVDPDNSSWPSMTLDEYDNPHISYHDYYRKILKYATKGEGQQQRSLSLDIDPDTLNLKSLGRWITAYLRTENAEAEDIDASSLLLNDVIPPSWWDVQNDTTLMVKFSRSAVQAMVSVADEVDIKVTGQWKDGEVFELHDTIRVINPGAYGVTHRSLSMRYIPPRYFVEEYEVLTSVREPMEGPNLNQRNKG
jgi:hypothetical protein